MCAHKYSKLGCVRSLAATVAPPAQLNVTKRKDTLSPPNSQLQLLPPDSDKGLNALSDAMTSK
jgi:hypothetical protein